MKKRKKEREGNEDLFEQGRRGGWSHGSSGAFLLIDFRVYRRESTRDSIVDFVREWNKKNVSEE